MERNTYGYARVSSKEQNENRQLDALRKFPIAPENIFIDKQSGKDFDRPAWGQLLRKAKPGDLIVVQSIDRLGRNYKEIQEQWRTITKERQIDIVIMDMPLLDTRSKNKDLTRLFISDIVLQILSYVAENERAVIKKRQAEGIEAAKKRGVRFGRPRKALPDEFYSIVLRWRRKEITINEALEACGMSKGCFYRNLKEKGL